MNLSIEKLITSTLDEAQAITAACEKAGTKLGIGYLLRSDPRYAHVKELIASGRTGAPIHLYARRNSSRTEGSKRYAGELPLALHVKVQDVDLALCLLEGLRPVSVYAQQTDRVLGSTGTQDSIAAIGRFSDGTVVNLQSALSLPAGARPPTSAKCGPRVARKLSARRDVTITSRS